MFSYWLALTYRRGESSVSDNGHVSPEVCISTLSEELQELVQNVFGLGKRQHKFYCETEIPKQVPCSKEGPKVWSLKTFIFQTFIEENGFMGTGKLWGKWGNIHVGVQHPI